MTKHKQIQLLALWIYRFTEDSELRDRFIIEALKKLRREKKNEGR